MEKNGVALFEAHYVCRARIEVSGARSDGRRRRSRDPEVKTATHSLHIVQAHLSKRRTWVTRSDQLNFLATPKFHLYTVVHLQHFEQLAGFDVVVVVVVINHERGRGLSSDLARYHQQLHLVFLSLLCVCVYLDERKRKHVVYRKLDDSSFHSRPSARTHCPPQSTVVCGLQLFCVSSQHYITNKVLHWLSIEEKTIIVYTSPVSTP